MKSKGTCRLWFCTQHSTGDADMCPAHNESWQGSGECKRWEAWVSAGQQCLADRALADWAQRLEKERFY